MKRVSLVITWLAAGSVVASSWAQESPPFPIDVVSIQISRNLSGTYVGPFGPFEDFDPDSDSAKEFDAIEVVIKITDPDWSIEFPDDGGELQFEVETFYSRALSSWDPLLGESPTPAPIPWVGAFIETAPVGLVQEPGPAGPIPTALATFGPFFIPDFIGPTQQNLRDPDQPDGAWTLFFDLADDQDAEVFTRSSLSFVVFANELNQPSNPGPRAEAGADQRVLINSTVTLDASRSFDGYNVGFDPTLPNIFDGDTLTYTWDFVSGPAVVNPIQSDPSSPTATVTLNDPSDADPDNLVPYVFRVTASDNQSPTSTSDTVEILVFTEMPPNEPPSATITVVTPTPLVGDQVVLSALGSTDPEVGELTYLWQQTDELGNPIGPEDLDAFFQPLSDVESPTVDWVATRAGTFYFRVLVTDDGGLTDTAFVSITVLDPNSVLGQRAIQARAGTLDIRNLTQADGAGDAAADPEPLAVPVCGGSLLPLMIVPFVLPLMRPRRQG